MKIIKPRALQRGDVIGIAAPASPPVSDEDVAKGIRYLEQLGYRIEVGFHLYQRRGYLAGLDAERTSDLHQLFSNRKISAVFSLRGGYGCTRLLPLLDFTLLRKNPKILVGYSDITALQMALFQKCGLVTFSGPMVSSDMSHEFSGEAEEQFWSCLTTKKKMKSIRVSRKNHLPYQSKNAAGTLLGGNLSILSSLIGTSYFPRRKDLLLLLEEIDERPYRIDRMLHQMKLSGIFQRTCGVVLGEFKDCTPEKGKPSLSFKEVFHDVFEEYEFPVVGHVKYGHIRHSLTLPLGVRVQLNSSKGELHFLENALS